MKTRQKYARLVCYECIELSEGADSGERFLTEAQYEKQLSDPNHGWRCPSCNCYPCGFDDEYFEQEVSPI